MEEPALTAPDSLLSGAEKKFIIEILQSTQLSGNAAALSEALTLIDNIIHKLSPKQNEKDA